MYKMPYFQRFPKWSSKAVENDRSLIIAEEIEIHKGNMTFLRALQGVSGRAATTAHSLMAEATGLSHPILDSVQRQGGSTQRC